MSSSFHDVLKKALANLDAGDKLQLARTPDGYDGFVAADLARLLSAGDNGNSATLLHIARDGQRSRAFRQALEFAAPAIEIFDFPAWDCQPYDRVSPERSISARRMSILSRLARTKPSTERPRIITTTVNAIVQRIPKRDWMARESFAAAPGNSVDMKDLVTWLETNGFSRSPNVRETGEYAVRGGIVDLFAAGTPDPLRLDFFGDTLESIRTFDAENQRTTGQLRELELVPTSEVQITSQTIRMFRAGYLKAFGANTSGDPLYEAVSEGRRYPGMEHWLPLFYNNLDTLFDYLPDVPVMVDPLVDEVVSERLDEIADYFQARTMHLETSAGTTSYKPLPTDALYINADHWQKQMSQVPVVGVTPYALPDASAGVIDCHGRAGRDFAPERNTDGTNVFEAVRDHIQSLQKTGQRCIIAGWSEGSRDRLSSVLGEHDVKGLTPVGSLSDALALPAKQVPVALLGIEHGFETPEIAIIGEQDILGDRLVQARRRKGRPQDFLTEATSLSAGDIVVHVEHGIARFFGLKVIEAAGAPHDCLELHYSGGDKLFLPVENIELLSRYGSEDTEVQLDKLGGVGWQARKARMKNRIREIAHQLIKVAAERQLRKAPVLQPPQPAYEEFSARFAYQETEDQLGAIEAVLEDLAAGRPMDRLICGDVGFGKTEVALRAAFAAAIEGKQVAVVVPTTLLARQHHKNFAERFHGLPVRVEQVSRMVPSAELRTAKQGIADGTVDIAIGTHALLGKSVKFKDLGLVIVDEEQHFGVNHKERLKEMRTEVHVLTLSATPIPRTLQLALSGVRELSLIASPPVDRLAVRTFITPFDELIVREALLRERFRGGQSFYVCPRIEDISDAVAFLQSNVPEAKFITAHGQMTPGELEERMAAFYDGKYDILVSTAIVESGLDIPTANTMIVHRADMFGLAQLYQLRGRVGRSKTRAYALFTIPANRTLTVQAEKRLKVLQSLDTLGAGFQLASHDLDIRGAGNLLGDEQSGHIKEVGFELYQQMLDEAISTLKAGIEEPAEETWSPTISIGTAVTIPEDYVSDLSLRLTLYRRLADVETDVDIEALGAEMIDRFGPMPEEVKQLLKLVSIKALCRRAHVEKVDAGPKGVTIAFRDNSFADPAGLVRYVTEQGLRARVRHEDMRVVFVRSFADADERLEGTRQILRTLVGIAEKQAA